MSQGPNFYQNDVGGDIDINIDRYFKKMIKTKIQIKYLNW